MKKIRLLSLLLVSTFCVGVLTGCGESDHINQLKALESLGSENNGSTENYSLSVTESEKLVYSQVADRTLLDLSTLDPCTEGDIQQVVAYMNSVDEQLTGTTNEDNGVISQDLINYMLAWFEKTPYYWQRAQTTLRGVDPTSKSVVVDVVYKTIGTTKKVIPESTIVRGDKNYDTLMSVRQDHWLEYLQTKLEGDADSMITAQQLYNDFVSVYGEPELIFEAQKEDELATDMYETGEQITYTGCTDGNAEKCGGTLTFRFVLVPNYSMGINLGMSCQHMYVTSYTLDNDITEDKELFKDDGYATVTDKVYQLMYSYFTCIDEADFEGLNKLTNHFERVDNYYKDLFDYSYRKNYNCAISIFDITGTHITCGVTVSSKERARGSNMTFPIYTDRYYVEIEFAKTSDYTGSVSGELKVEDITLLSRKLDGEPAIKTTSADTEGFTATIALSKQDKQDIEKLINNFGVLQLRKDVKSDSFFNVVDQSMTTGELTNLQEAATSLSGDRKVTWLLNYQQGTSNYASVLCRECYQNSKNEIIEAETTYDFINKSNRWYIMRYTIDNTIKLDTTNLKTTGSLSLVTSEKVEQYTSQLKGTSSESLDESKDSSVTFTHTTYDPIAKRQGVEQGYTRVTVADISDEQLKNALSLPLSSVGMTYEELTALTTKYSQGVDLNALVKECAVLITNIMNNNYTIEERKSVLVNDASVLCTKIDSAIGTVTTNFEKSDEKGKKDVEALSAFLDVCSGMIEQEE